MTSLDTDYYSQVCQKKGGIWTFYTGLSGSGAALTLLRSDVPPVNVSALPIPPATFVLKIIASSVTGHTDMTGDVIVNAEHVAFTGAATKYSTTGLTAIPVITTSGLDCNLVITAYQAGSSEIYEWFSSACRWKDDAIIFMTSAGAWTQSKALIITDAVYVVGDTLRIVGGSDTYGQLVKMITVQLNIDGVAEARTYFI